MTCAHSRCDVLTESAAEEEGASDSSIRCNIAVTLASAAIVTCFLSIGLRNDT